MHVTRMYERITFWGGATFIRNGRDHTCFLCCVAGEHPCSTNVQLFSTLGPWTWTHCETRQCLTEVVSLCSICSVSDLGLDTDAQITMLWFCVTDTLWRMYGNPCDVTQCSAPLTFHSTSCSLTHHLLPAKSQSLLQTGTLTHCWWSESNPGGAYSRKRLGTTVKRYSHKSEIRERCERKREIQIVRAREQ